MSGNKVKLKVFIPSLLLIVAILLVTIPVSVSAQISDESSDFSYALKLYNEGFYDIAAQQFSLFINRYPTSNRVPDAKFYLANSYFQLKDYKNARIEYQALAVGYPKNSHAPEAWFKAAECYEKLNQPAEAAKTFETVKILYPKHALAPRALLRATENFLQINQLNEAERVIKDFLDRYVTASEYPQGRMLFGTILLKKGNYNRALQEFEKAEQQATDKAIKIRAEIGRAEVYQKLGLLQKAEQSLLSLIKEDVNTRMLFEIVDLLVGNYRLQGNVDAAIQLINKEIDRIKDSELKAILEYQLGAFYFRKKEFDLAQKQFRKIIEKHRVDSLKYKIQFALANTLVELNAADEGTGLFTKLLQMAVPASLKQKYEPIIFKQLIRIELENQQTSQAILWLHELQNKYPNFPLNEQIHSEAINRLLTVGKISTAQKEYERFVQLYPGSAQIDDLAFALGKALFVNGQIRESYKYFRQISIQFTSSEKFDSSQIYLKRIREYFPENKGIASLELAKLLGKMLADENKNKLRLELAKIYIEQFREFADALPLVDKIREEANDSSMLAQANYLRSLAMLRLYEKNQFMNVKDAPSEETVFNSLKEAMLWVSRVPHPDTLTFWFLKFSSQEGVTPQKQLEFWEHFVRTYPNSPLTELARLQIFRLAEATADTNLALTQLNTLLRAKQPLIRGRAYWLMAKYYEKQNQEQKKIDILKEFLLNIPEHPLRAQAYRELALSTEKMQNYTDAAQFLERLIQQYPYSDLAQAAREKIAALYLKAGQPDKTILYIEKNIAATTDSDPFLRFYGATINPNWHYLLGKAYYLKGDHILARQYLSQFLSGGGSSEYRNESFYLLGKIAYEEGDVETALFHLSFVKAESPIYIPATELAAKLLYDQQKYKDAAEKYAELIKVAPSEDKRLEYETQQILTQIHRNQLKLTSTAISKFKKAYRKNPSLKEKLALFEFETGKVQYQNKNFNTAVKHFQTVLKKYKKSAYADDALYYLGLSYTTMNKTEDAEKTLMKFIDTYPSSDLLGNVYIALGTLYFRTEKNELAVSSFKKALEVARKPETRQSAMSNLIAMYQNLGLWDGALMTARQYIEEFPNASDVVDKKILVGVSLIRLNRYSEAIDFLKKLKFEAASEQEPEIQFYIGEAYFNAGQYEDAIREFVKIPLLSRQTKLQWEASALYYSGQAYERLGRIKDAIRMYKEIVERPGILVELKREARKRIDQLSQ